MLIGITGGSGCGKSTICEELKKAGIEIIDADTAAREVTAKGSPALDEIKVRFGNEFFASDGSLLRKKLGSLVFSDEQALADLNSITHKYIDINIDNKIKKSSAQIICIDAPLLFEYGMNKRCDLVVSVIADKKDRIHRICQRDGLSEKEAENRINSQHSDEFYLEKSDYIVYNNGTRESLFSEIKKLIEYLREKL